MTFSKADIALNGSDGSVGRFADVVADRGEFPLPALGPWRDLLLRLERMPAMAWLRAFASFGANVRSGLCKIIVSVGDECGECATRLTAVPGYRFAAHPEGDLALERRRQACDMV